MECEHEMLVGWMDTEKGVAVAVVGLRSGEHVVGMSTGLKFVPLPVQRSDRDSPTAAADGKIGVPKANCVSLPK